MEFSTEQVKEAVNSLPEVGISKEKVLEIILDISSSHSSHCKELKAAVYIMYEVFSKLAETRFAIDTIASLTNQGKNGDSADRIMRRAVVERFCQAPLLANNLPENIDKEKVIDIIQDIITKHILSFDEKGVAILTMYDIYEELH